MVQGHDLVGEFGVEEDFDEGPPYAHSRSRKATNQKRGHSDMLGNGDESLSLQQMLSLSAEWSVGDGFPHMRRPPQRHFSDCVKRGGRVRSTDFSRPTTTHSLEDFDNLSEVDSGLGLGRLTRTTNFCDILDADEYSNIHIADNRLSYVADSVLAESNEETGSPLQPLSKKWATFENGLASSVEEDSLETSEKLENPQNSDSAFGRGNPAAHPPGETESFASSTSDFSSAFDSSQNILVSSTEEAWGSSSVSASENNPVAKEIGKTLFKTALSKSDSCIAGSRSKSPPSNKEDMWNFTPDCVTNVSTGRCISGEK